jgi:predicted nicotinamide N-methyase
MKACARDADALRERLGALIPGAELTVQDLEDLPGLRLLLLRDTQAARGLDPELALRVMDDPLYWMFCWASGRVMARCILDKPELVRGRRVVDFGCGSAVVAIAAALSGAGEVIACDIDPLALEAAAFNARLNGIALTCTDSLEAVAGPVDLIFAADVLYDRGNLPWLQRLLARADTVWVADSRVRDFSEAGFERIAEHTSSTVPDLDESREFGQVSLYLGSSADRAAGME